MLLKKKTAIITGCNRGIGEKILEKFSSSGANIFACTRKKNSEFESKISELARKYKVKIIPIYFDFADSEEIKSAARQVYRCRRQHKFGGKLDFSGISEKLDEIGGTSWAQDPNSGRFAINYNNQTVGTDDNVISLKR